MTAHGGKPGALSRLRTRAWFSGLLSLLILLLCRDAKAQFGDPLQVLEPGSCAPLPAQVADMDQDGDTDVVTRRCEGGSTSLVWVPNDGETGAFLDPVVIGSVEVEEATVAFSVADLNEDGRPDILAGWTREPWGEPLEPIAFVWYENRDAGTIFASKALGSPPPWFEVVDVDGDSHLDVVEGSDWLIQWRRNADGSGNFEEARTLVESPGDAHLLVDLDGDGDRDVVMMRRTEVPAEYQLRWWPFEPGYVFQYELVLPIGSGPGNPAPFQALDVDGDGDRDLLYGGRWYENVGGSGLGWRVAKLSIVGGGREIADLDGDGDLDLVTSTWLSAPETFQLQWYIAEPGHFLREGPGTWAGNEYAYTDWVDLDCDGDLDALTSSFTLSYVSWKMLDEDGFSDGGYQMMPDPTVLLAVQLVGHCGADLLNLEYDAGLRRLVVRENQMLVVDRTEEQLAVGAHRVGPAYPNPARSWFNLPLAGVDAGTVRVEVRDLLGRTVWAWRESAGASVVRVDVSHLAPGLYLYQAELDEGPGFRGSVLVDR